MCQVLAQVPGARNEQDSQSPALGLWLRGAYPQVVVQTSREAQSQGSVCGEGRKQPDRWRGSETPAHLALTHSDHLNKNDALVMLSRCCPFSIHSHQPHFHLTFTPGFWTPLYYPEFSSKTSLLLSEKRIPSFCHGLTTWEET